METPPASQSSVVPDDVYAPTSVIAGHYRVERELGRGGMATVYLCTDVRTQNRVAVKVLRQELGSAVVIERFLREITFASQLDHPQIPKVMDSGVIDGIPYYVMTYVEGESLKKRIEREKQLPIGDALSIACEVVKPTAYAHARGIIHRDLKPENIIISKEGVFVLDFGIARALIESGVDRLTSTGIGVGTPAYMSPEQALGDRNLDVRSDVYSLGCVVYEMIAGIPPFVGPTAQVIISRRFAAPPPPLVEVREGIPESIEDAVSRALAKAPADRWPTAEAFGKALNACRDDANVTGSTYRYAIRRSTQRRSAIVILAVGVIAASGLTWSAAYRDPIASAHRAIAVWDFEKAEALFRKAVAIRRWRSDFSFRSNDPRAQLWLAQIMMLEGRSVDEWKSFAVGAADHRTELGESDRTRSDALLARTGEQFSTACKAFRALAENRSSKDDEEIVSTLAYGDCIRNDPTVIQDPKSPSGYNFKSSAQQADSVYQALLERHEGSSSAYAVVMPRLAALLVTQKGMVRPGRMSGSNEVFLAMPSINADTLIYVPSPYKPSSGPWQALNAADVPAAIARNRARLRELALRWSKAAPADPQPHEFLASILEATGKLGETEEVSALGELHTARALAANFPTEDQTAALRNLRLANSQVRIYLKLGSFDRAAALADTALRWRVPTDLTDKRQDSVTSMIAGLATLRGRLSTVIAIGRRFALDQTIPLPGGGSYTLPGSLARDYVDFTTYAAFGNPKDSLLAAIDRIKRSISALIPADQAPAVSQSIFSRSLRIAAPTLGAKFVADELRNEDDGFMRALRAAASGRKEVTRYLLDSIARSRIGFAPGEVTLDVVYPEAWLRWETGDVSGAASYLDNALRGLPAARPNILQDVATAAAVIHMMNLRAHVASRMHDTKVADYWTGAVRQFWGAQAANQQLGLAESANSR